jgi:hypothetical protein
MLTIKQGDVFEELWESVAGWEGLYEVSSKGNVRSLDRFVLKSGKDFFVKGKRLKLTKNNIGYIKVCLCSNGYQQVTSVHRLVALAFVDNPSGYPEVNHKDGNKENNNVENLEWCTTAQNVKHAYENNLVPVAKYGTDHPSAKGLIEVILHNEVVDLLCGNTDMINKGYIPSCVCRVIQGKLKTHRGFTYRRL